MKKMFALVHLALGTSLMFGMTTALLAQPTAGAIRGTVLDPSGGLIPEAEVIVTSVHGFSQSVRSSSTGAFELPDLAPGSYSVNIHATGFTSALETVQVVKDAVTREDVKLRITVDQEIDVLAGDDGVSETKR